jgi:hypothetical protein
LISKIGLTLFCLTLTASGACAKSEPEAWSIWSVSDESVVTAIDHSAWGEFLGRYLQAHESGINFVAYSAVTISDRNSLRAYLKQLTDQDPRQLRKTEQLAYWINLYNALTVEVVLRNPDKDGIRNMGERLFSSGPWDDKLIKIAGESLSLNDIEHRILRPIWRDHRIHYVVNCASISCPNLAPVPYTAECMEDMFSDAEKSYINHPRGVRFDDQGQLTLAKLYSWYSDDFADDEAELLRYLSTHHATAAVRLREYAGRVRYNYDWSLNSSDN